MQIELKIKGQSLPLKSISIPEIEGYKLNDISLVKLDIITNGYSPIIIDKDFKIIDGVKRYFALIQLRHKEINVQMQADSIHHTIGNSIIDEILLAA